MNYGWHVEPTSKPLPFPVSHNAAIPGLWVIQDAEGRHDAYHEDYSQLCMLVAPWCMVAWVGHDEKLPMRTADVYQSLDLAGLVTDDALPLQGIRQPFIQERLAVSRARFWERQGRIYEAKRARGIGLLDPRPARSSEASGPETGIVDGPAPALVVLREQIDARWPDRRRTQDGIVGHHAQNPHSDHEQGNALDVTRDPERGPDLEVLGRRLLADPRTHYVIYNRRIANPDRQGGAWRPYGGGWRDPHEGHLHLSIRPEMREDARSWALPEAPLWGVGGALAADASGPSDGALTGVTNVGLALGEGALARSGAGGRAAAAGAKLGGAIGGTVGSAAVATSTALAAAGIIGATTVAFSVVPVIGTIAGAVMGAVAAISYWAGKDKYHPSPLQAQQLLALFRADPGLLFEGVDKLTTKSGNRKHPPEELAARHIRYLKQVAGEEPLHGPLYNPISNDSCTNPYMCRVDPRDPLTDPGVLHRVKVQVQVHHLAPPAISSPEQAAAVLKVLRTDLVAKGNVVGWSEIKSNLPALRREVAYLRTVAGETEPDPVLDKILGEAPG